MKVKIHREGVNILIVLLLMLLAVNSLVWFFMRPLTLPYIFTGVSVVIYLLVLNFFRSPKRQFVGLRAPGVVVASADGKVVALEETYEDEVLHCRCIQLSVFMSVFNVHANWSPVDGTVKQVRHYSGRYMSAFLPKSSKENEHTSIAIESTSGSTVVMRQVAGALARRIVTYAVDGDDASIDDHIGFIKFGSRIDLFLPLDTKVLVKLGDKTIGGITQVAVLPEK